MARRFGAFVLAFVIAGAPVAASVCQVACETHQTHDVAAMAGHAHHSSVGPTRDAATDMSDVPHRCGHPSAAAVGVQQSVQVLDAPTVIAVEALLVPPVDLVALTTRPGNIDHSPPGNSVLVTQLRV